MKQSLRTMWFLPACLVILGTSEAHSASLTLQQPTATFSQTDSGSFPIADAIDANLGTGWAIHPSEISQTAVFETSVDVFSSGGSLTFTLIQNYGTEHTIGRFRLSATTDDRALFADGLATGGDVVANWVVLNPTSFSSSNGATLAKLIDNSILASGLSPATDTYTVSLTTSLAGITGLRLELLEDPSLPLNGPGRQPSNSNLVLSEFIVNADATVVPVPASLWLLGSALGGIGMMRRRRA